MLQAGGGDPPSPYLDRVCPPEQTVARVRPFFAEFGITRLARQTGLDCIGIPCWAAFRPNALTLANNQGKGLSDAAAMASAVMEAVEFAIAERPRVQAIAASVAELNERSESVFDIRRLLPIGSKIDERQTLRWLQGAGIASGAPVWVPFDAAAMDPAIEIANICQSTNGLASGNTPDEALFHALCELIERDATSLWSVLSPLARLGTAIDPLASGDPMVAALAARITAAGFTLRLFDQTTDIGVPVIMAVIGGAESRGSRHFEITAGYGCHPVAARAAIRAITEAAQTRVTAIAGSRDDIDPQVFAADSAASVRRLLEATPVIRWPQGLPFGASPTALLRSVMRALDDASIAEPVAVWLAGPEPLVPVVKLLSTQLEDREANFNWRPGFRAVAEIMRAAA